MWRYVLCITVFQSINARFNAKSVMVLMPLSPPTFGWFYCLQVVGKLRINYCFWHVEL